MAESCKMTAAGAGRLGDEADTSGAGLGHCHQPWHPHRGSVPNPAMGLGLAGSILDLPERASA